MVFDSIRGLFGKKQEDTQNQVRELTIRLEEVPGWLEDQRTDASSVLKTEMNRFRKAFEENERVLGGLVSGLPAPDPNAEASPKVRSVIGKSYPQFKKAIASHIVSQYPDDPEIFYKAVTESLKGCVAALKGPGKYLHLLFPDQMKEIKARVASIGRDVNELTKILSVHRTTLATIERAEEAVRQIQRRQDRQEHLGSKYAEHQQKLHTLKRRVKDLDEECEKLYASHEYQVLKTLDKKLKTAIDTENRSFDNFRVLAWTATHTLHRASKVLSRSQGHEPQIHILEQCVTVLESLEPPQLEEISDLAVSAGQLVSDLVTAGEINLKNKEERVLFSSGASLSSHVSRSLLEYVLAKKERKDAEEVISGNPLALDLEKKKTELHATRQMLAREEAHERQMEEKQRQFEVTGPGTETDLEEALSELGGMKVTVCRP